MEWETRVGTECKQSAFRKYEKFAGDSFEKKLWEDCRVQLDKAVQYGDSDTIKYLRQTIQPYLEEIGAKKCRIGILGTSVVLPGNKEKYSVI